MAITLSTTAAAAVTRDDRIVKLTSGSGAVAGNASVIAAADPATRKIRASSFGI